MEPLKINWAKIESRFVTDELYEHINAPQWVDLSSSFDAGSAGEDDAWFCRPECRHPKSADDFLSEKWRTTPTPKSKSKRGGGDTEVLKTLTERKCNTIVNANNCHNNGNADATIMSKNNTSGDSRNNLKRRGGGILQPTAILRTPKPTQKAASMKKKFDTDAENRDPNLQQHPSDRMMTSKLLEEASGTGVEEKPTSEVPRRREVTEDAGSAAPNRRRLRSTLSARNLFAGRDLFAQISGFYGEIKKWITVRRKEEEVFDMEGNDNGLTTKLETHMNTDGDPNHRRRSAGQAVKSNASTAADGGRQQPHPTTYAYQLGQQDNVRSHPPSPQRFPSPMTCSKQCKPAVATPSPLKPLKSRPVPAASNERTILGDLVFSTTPSPVGEKACNFIPRGGNADAKPLDMLWFMKPCTYLGR